MEEQRFKAARKEAKRARRQASAEQQAAAVQLQLFVRARASNALRLRWLEVAAQLAANSKRRAAEEALRLTLAAKRDAKAARAAQRMLPGLIADLEESCLKRPTPLAAPAVAAILLTGATVADGRSMIRMRGGTGCADGSGGEDAAESNESLLNFLQSMNPIRSPAAAVRARRNERCHVANGKRMTLRLAPSCQ